MSFTIYLANGAGLHATELLLLVGDGEVGSGSGLVLVADHVGNDLILGLLSRGLVVLRAGAHELLLAKVNGCEVKQVGAGVGV